MSKELRDAAAGYLALGLPVIALTGKTPNVKVHRNGLYNALIPGDDLAVFDHKDTTGVGIVIPRQYVVVDIDSEVGAENWKNLVGADQYIPERWVARTAHGLHIWYGSVHPTGSFRPFDKEGGGVDIKGSGGYVAAPPSWHPGYPDEGIAPGYHYQWIAEPTADYPPFDMPEQLEEKIRKRNAVHDASVRGKLMRTPVALDRRLPGLFYATVSYQGIIDAVRKMSGGNRNNVLYWAAATLRDEGADDSEFKALLDAAVEAGLPTREAGRTIRSAMSSPRE